MLKSFSSYKKIAILGFGREGRSTLQFLRKRGVDIRSITILDCDATTDIPDGIMSVLGERYTADL